MPYFATIFIIVILAHQVVLQSPNWKKSVLIGDTLYFADASTALRSRADALEYCLDEGAELAKITNRQLYDILRLALTEQGTYWIDGIDKESSERFELDNRCNAGELDFSGFQPGNLVLTPKQCLALVKGSSQSTSMIQAVDCIIPYRVLCSFTQSGCNGGSTIIPSA